MVLEVDHVDIGEDVDALFTGGLVLYDVVGPRATDQRIDRGGIEIISGQERNEIRAVVVDRRVVRDRHIVGTESGDQAISSRRHRDAAAHTGVSGTVILEPRGRIIRHHERDLPVRPLGSGGGYTVGIRRTVRGTQRERMGRGRRVGQIEHVGLAGLERQTTLLCAIDGVDVAAVAGDHLDLDLDRGRGVENAARNGIEARLIAARGGLDFQGIHVPPWVCR